MGCVAPEGMTRDHMGGGRFAHFEPSPRSTSASSARSRRASGAVDATGTFVSGDPGCPAGGGGGVPPAFTMTSTPASSAASPITVPASVAVGWSGATNATGCYVNTSGTVPADVASA